MQYEVSFSAFWDFVITAQLELICFGVGYEVIIILVDFRLFLYLSPHNVGNMFTGVSLKAY